ncbi:hypothetical protein ALC53_02531 [Atta colombica]|uniref:Uncharacterized protein n=1 Tax=Atta colombica TaxID=520822 RepID=A0A195BQB6_9HYME|nr:hypothetical protein ALC53_02531 [Atta colombica]
MRCGATSGSGVPRVSARHRKTNDHGIDATTENRLIGQGSRRFRTTNSQAALAAAAQECARNTRHARSSECSDSQDNNTLKSKIEPMRFMVCRFSALPFGFGLVPTVYTCVSCLGPGSPGTGL